MLNGPVGSNHGSLARARARGAGSHTDHWTTASSGSSAVRVGPRATGAGTGQADVVAAHGAI